ncbi:MAG: hypothetical protein ACHREM_16770 [Polyangiales bacterium]
MTIHRIPSADSYMPHAHEGAKAYAARLRSTLLPSWPEEVLIEWLHRHPNQIGHYSFLDFATFRFRLETWPRDAVPGGEAFGDPIYQRRWLDFGSNLLTERVKRRGDWLARYMCEHGTWNTPIVLLRNDCASAMRPDDTYLGSPFHLLEGHRRLSFLNKLRVENLAGASHQVWVVEREF